MSRINTRLAIKAHDGWYPWDEAKCLELINNFAGSSGDFLTSTESFTAGIVPHAGWLYSGHLACKTIQLLAANRPQTSRVIVLSVDHRGVCHDPSFATFDCWETPLGDLKVDYNSIDTLLCNYPTLFHRADAPHQFEHSLEIQLPFIKYFFPNVKIIPLAIPSDEQLAVQAGTALAHSFQSDDTLVLGSTDLSHYGENFYFSPQGIGPDAYRWVMEEADALILKAIKNLEVDEIFSLVRKHQSACGSGPIVATLSYLHKKGITSGEIVGHTSSLNDSLAAPDPDYSNFVTYGGLVF